ncbi:RNA polymerase subunit sigma [Zavarzinia compransoris]|uniref:RNA polymerase subunit sigma n=2 Tax=Zavarzinia compransoris TaxID=1264899 RepID=A0A317EG06_9PROT|nr:RNA polymerase subunit sigma [Zavarzinia compransoris]
MQAAQDGDRRAYATLLQAITPYLRAQVRRYLRNPADVEDVVQEILLTVHRVRQTYDPARPFMPWLVAIARRRVVDRLRSKGRLDAREVVVAPDDETFTMAAANTEAEPPDHEALRAAVAKLPQGQRLAVELLKFQDLSLREASEKSGMTVGALKVAAHRAYKALRAALGGKAEADDERG